MKSPSNTLSPICFLFFFRNELTHFHIFVYFIGMNKFLHKIIDFVLREKVEQVKITPLVFCKKHNEAERYTV